MNRDLAAAVAGAALVLVPAAWRRARHVVTLVHEAGHAGVAVATGRRLNGIRLHTDTSGLTVSSGRPRGPGMIATAAAGYVAPSALGLLSLVLVRADRTPWALWTGIVVLAAMLLYIRNGWGLLVVLLSGLAVGLLTWKADAAVQDVAAGVLAWFLLVGGFRGTIDLWGHRRRVATRTTDADVLARLTHLPAWAWNLLFVMVTGAALGGSVLIGWPDVLP